MDKILLNAEPNQTQSCMLGGRLFDILVQRGASGSTLLSVTVDGVSLFNTQRSVNGAQMMLPPLDKQYGNLVWVCSDKASYPDYKLFGTLHNLYWWGFDEVFTS